MEFLTAKGSGKGAAKSKSRDTSKRRPDFEDDGKNETITKFTFIPKFKFINYHKFHIYQLMNNREGAATD